MNAKKRSTHWYDKYGREIFEGDKIKSDRQSGCVTIIWNEKKCRFETDSPKINKIFDPSMLRIHGIVFDAKQTAN